MRTRSGRGRRATSSTSTRAPWTRRSSSGSSPTARAAPASERPRLLDEALRLWRGPPYAEIGDAVFAQGDVRRLEELWLVATEERLGALAETGEHAALVGELEGLVARYPHRERLHALLMLSLYRSGRQAEALDAYHTARRILVDELSVEPGRELQELHRAILRHERSLDVDVPAPAPRDHAADVLRALLAGRLVPVLGPGVALQQEGASDTELANRLCELFECPADARGSLARVSQYVSLIDGVGPLYDELHDLLDRDYGPGPVDRFLATLPPLLRARGAQQPLVVTTRYDETLEATLAAAGEEFDVVSYIARGPDRGRFLHVPAGGTPRVVREPNADATVNCDRVPVILKVHGCVDRSPAREWESFVVSEDDYIDYLASVEPVAALPVRLAARLRRSHLLFLGYDVLDWNLRVFLRRIWGEERVSYRSWAVQPDPRPPTRDFWRHRNVDVYDTPLDAYVEELETLAHDAERALA